MPSATQFSNSRMPVTVLTGFLGAGKTTLLNAVLKNEVDERIAVIVNEFGEQGLDHDLIETSDEDVILMQSGCLCCSLRGDLSNTVGELLERRDAGHLSFDRIVIETTGMADPAPILQTFLLDPMLARNTRMDGLVTVTDAVNGPSTLDAHFEAVSQVALADLILLSKTDLVNDPVRNMFEDRLRALNPTADIKPIERPIISSKDFRGLTGLRNDIATPQAVAWTTPQWQVREDPLGGISGISFPKEPANIGALHDARISAGSIVLEHPLQDKVFDFWLDTLIALKGPDILRVKGIVFLEGIDAPFVFHGVQHIFDPPIQLKHWSGQDKRSRIVVIARDVSHQEIQRSFDVLKGPQPA